MFDRLGKRKYIIPFIIGIVVAFFMAVMFYPMLNMQLKDLPFAVLSLDEGVETQAGTINAGDTMVDTLISSNESDDEDSAIAWTQVYSQSELDEAMDNGEYYGAIVIPKDYSAEQYAAQQAENQALIEQAQALLAAQAAMQTQSTLSGATDMSASSQDSLSVLTDESQSIEDSEEASSDSPSITVLIDYAKSPLIATQMENNIATMFSSLGVNVDIEALHENVTNDDSDNETSTTNLFGSMMSLQLSVLPLFIISAITALMISRIIKIKQAKTASDRAKKFGIQALIAFIASFIATLCVLGILAFYNIGFDFGVALPFMWLASFCVMLLFIGASDIALGLGIGILLLCFCLGMMLGVLPYDVLPAFWQDWVWPWSPQHYIGEGMRSVLYLNRGIGNSATLPLIIIGIVGLVLACISFAMPKKQK